jgi:TPR repeat protein
MTLWLRAGELGCAVAYGNVGNAYHYGQGVEMDTKKAKHYWGLAAMRGNVGARHNLGEMEHGLGNMKRAVKHWMIAAGAGCDKSLKKIRECFMAGQATKEDFEKALRAHKDSKDEMKSDQREEIAALMKRKDARRQAANWLQLHGDIKLSTK